MKKQYAQPSLVEFGTIGRLTLGAGGGLPDYDANFNLINNTCDGQTFVDSSGQTRTRTGCLNS
jgi:hypothetical protein